MQSKQIYSIIKSTLLTIQIPDVFEKYESILFTRKDGDHELDWGLTQQEILLYKIVKFYKEKRDSAFRYTETDLTEDANELLQQIQSCPDITIIP